jgi:hypothetical protein
MTPCLYMEGHREGDRHGRGDDGDQDRVRADVNAAAAGQHAVDQGEKSPGTAGLAVSRWGILTGATTCYASAFSG